MADRRSVEGVATFTHSDAHHYPRQNCIHATNQATMTRYQR